MTTGPRRLRHHWKLRNELGRNLHVVIGGEGDVGVGVVVGRGVIGRHSAVLALGPRSAADHHVIAEANEQRSEAPLLLVANLGQDEVEVSLVEVGGVLLDGLNKVKVENLSAACALSRCDLQHWPGLMADDLNLRTGVRLSVTLSELAQNGNPDL